MSIIVTPKSPSSRNVGSHTTHLRSSHHARVEPPTMPLRHRGSCGVDRDSGTSGQGPYCSRVREPLSPHTRTRAALPRTTVPHLSVVGGRPDPGESHVDRP